MRIESGRHENVVKKLCCGWKKTESPQLFHVEPEFCHVSTSFRGQIDKKLRMKRMNLQQRLILL